MQVNISIEYFTNPGESLILKTRSREIPMNYVSAGIWTASLEVPSSLRSLDYGFELRRDGITVRREWAGHSTIVHSGKKPAVFDIRERWNDRPSDSPFWTKAFSEVIFNKKVTAANRSGNLTLMVAASQVRSGETLAITGSGPLFGDWTKFVPMGAWAMAIVLAFLGEVFGDEHKVSGLIHPDVHYVYPVASGTKVNEKVQNLRADLFLKYWRDLMKANPYALESEVNEAFGIEGKQTVINNAEAKEILESVYLTAVEGGWKAVVVYLPEKMNASAANRLLKAVEEPPEKTLFLMVTHAPEKVMQIIFKQLGWIVSIIMIISTTAALTLVPMLCSRFLRSGPKTGKLHRAIFDPIERFLDNLSRWYSILIGWAVTHRKTVVLGAFAIFVAVLALLAPGLKTEFFPTMDEGRLSVSIELPVGTEQSVTGEFARNFAERMQKEIPEIQVLQYRYGDSVENDGVLAALRHFGVI